MFIVYFPLSENKKKEKEKKKKGPYMRQKYKGIAAPFFTAIFFIHFSAFDLSRTTPIGWP